jgi:osmotically-inducible protein OsmY
MTRMKNVMKYLMCITLILAFAGCAGTRTKESTGGYVDDSVITTKVKADLVADPVTKARAISVETFKGVVQLSGFVNTSLEKEKAGEIARNVRGVVDVKNNISVK